MTDQWPVQQEVTRLRAELAAVVKDRDKWKRLAKSRSEKLRSAVAKLNDTYQDALNTIAAQFE